MWRLYNKPLFKMTNDPSKTEGFFIGIHVKINTMRLFTIT